MRVLNTILTLLVLPLWAVPSWRVKRILTILLQLFPCAVAVRALTRALGSRVTGDDDCKVNFSAAWSLGRLGASALPYLSQLLVRRQGHNDDSWRRYWIAKAIGRIGGREALGILLQVLTQEEDPSVVGGAAEGVCSIRCGGVVGVDQAEVVAVLEGAYERFKDQRVYARDALSRELAEWRPEAGRAPQ